MSEPYLGQIKLVGFNFPPRGWAFCDGQLLPINQNQSLYSLLGTTYGGNGRTDFALPDLRGRVPIGEGQGIGANHPLGQKAGDEDVVLNISQIPQHTHDVTGEDTVNGSIAGVKDVSADTGSLGTAVAPNPLGGYFNAAASYLVNSYSSNAGNTTLGGLDGDLAINNAGNNSGHNNLQPYLVVNYIIALQGLFPSRN